MLNKDFIELLNSGEAVCFVGSGISCDANVPSWEKLYELISADLKLQQIDVSKSDVEYKKKSIPIAFSKLEELLGTKKNIIDELLVKHIKTNTNPGRYHKIIADWPFRSYITTNYDHLLDDILLKNYGWVSIGNTAYECTKLSGCPSKIIWHPHGGINLVKECNLRFVISENSYRETYPNSPIAETLKTVTRASRLVFIGFGFRDKDLIKLLETVAQVSFPSRPSFAFLGQEDNSETNLQEERDLYRSQYNVEVIPYNLVNNSHSDLYKILSAYSSFILKRSITFGENPKGSPNYDPSTTSLIVHNQLSEQNLVDCNIQESLCRAWILAIINDSKNKKEKDIIEELRCQNKEDSIIENSIRNLLERNLIQKNSDNTISLTKSGFLIVNNSVSTSELMKDKFKSAVTARFYKTASQPSIPYLKMVNIVCDFFIDIRVVAQRKMDIIRRT